MQIFIQMPAGGTVTLEVEASDTIENVKAKIELVEDEPASHPRIRSSSLLAACWRMGAPLSDYNIQKESTLNLSLVAACAAASGQCSMPTAAPLPPEACVADGLAWSGSVKSCCSGYAFGEWCTHGCFCAPGKNPVCHRDFVTNPPKNAILVSSPQPFCNALELELLALGTRKKCATTRGRLMDCMRQRIDPQTPKHICDFHPSLSAAACACPAKAKLCPQLRRLSTAAFGPYIPDEVERLMGCAPRAMSAAAAEGEPPRIASGDICAGYAPQVNSIMKPVLAKFWPDVSAHIPDPFRRVPAAGEGGATLIDSTGSSFEDIDIGPYWMRGKMGLDELKGLKRIVLPTLEITEVMQCANLSAIQTRIKLSTETTDLSIWGGLGLYFHSSFWPNFNTEASLKVTSRKARVTMLVTTNAGLIPSATGLQAVAAVTSIDELKLELGDVDFSVNFPFLIGGLFSWVLDYAVAGALKTVRSLWVTMDEYLSEQLLQLVFRPSLMKYMQAAVQVV
ncbi:hypothetical protein CHLNCDRAFT_135983 [Chlorella variabilis]|uniref:Ubiquitin-like domain-containing protein n=1 Tax=Chlorella variabilis TaxID=554065 RepID=E1ZJH9_CHLVA|nr:hypothetical protein CHLNCDRAFT_135983 [Chlorella variabilis]EFN53867.1 hypothetical protein CHLNCDRAFT_135983 [Chlorella variabilis]|eukprot:XP_005845969.1 hypothetical protein CHLNCDRAFT_135983 [Chlorella variabilis]